MDRPDRTDPADRWDGSDLGSGSDLTTEIDWHAIDDPRPCDDAPRAPVDRWTGQPVDRPTADASPLLEAGAPLDPARRGVDVAGLHPDRFTQPTAHDQRALEAAYRLDPTPETLVEGINPGVWSDSPADRAGRTMNCAECARAFQDGLGGRPRVAAAIGPEGLAPRGADRSAGETADYTEQWAGRRAELLSYPTLEQRVRESRGSAIVLGFGPEGGHAFNAYWDDDRRAVRWADGQVGLTGEWPPGDLSARFPDVRAIVFDEPRRIP